MSESYDVVVIGAGPVGENVADRAVQGGLTAVVVEDRLVGGECSYWACIPSKALLRPGEARRSALDVDGARQAVTGDLDVGAVLARRSSFTSGWDDAGQLEWLGSAGIDLVRGHGRVSGERQVTVTTPDGGERVLTARHAVAVCTGSRPVVPDIPGLRDARPWTNREALEATEVPESLLVIGGGVVASELAGAFADLGAQVTMLVRSELLSGYEPFAGEMVGAALEERGVDVRRGVSATSVRVAVDAAIPSRREPDSSVEVAAPSRRQPDPSVEVAAPSRREPDSSVEVAAPSRREPDSSVEVAAPSRRQPDSSVEVECDDGSTVRVAQILVATGREPQPDLGLASVGLEGGWLPVDETLRVLDGNGEPVEWLYAVGDANHRSPVTHQGKYQARAAGDVIAARAQGQRVDDAAWGVHAATADHLAPTQVVFTDPQVASVGMTAAAAQDAGMDVRVVDHDLGAVSGAAIHADGYTGRVRMVVDEERKVLVGMTFVGPGVAELLHSASVAVAGEVPLDRLWHAVPAFPTMSEVWLRLLESYGRPEAG